MFRRTAAVILAASVLVAASCGGGGVDHSSSGGSGTSGREVSGGVAIGPAPEGIEGVVAYRIDSHNHTEEDLEYDHRPPAGGDHNPIPATCGFYATDPPPDEFMVHSIEHGAIWIAYRPDLPDDQRDSLRDLVAEQAKVAATPYEGIDSPLVVTAWGRQLALESADDPRLIQFIETYRNSPNAPESTSPCQGVGQPDVTAPAT